MTLPDTAWTNLRWRIALWLIHCAIRLAPDSTAALNLEDMMRDWSGKHDGEQSRSAIFRGSHRERFHRKFRIAAHDPQRAFRSRLGGVVPRLGGVVPRHSGRAMTRYLDGYHAATRRMADFISRVGPSEIRARFPDFTRSEIIAAIHVLEWVRAQAATVTPQADTEPPSPDNFAARQQASVAARQAERVAEARVRG